MDIQDHIVDKAKELAGNWRRFDRSNPWRDDIGDSNPDHWAIYSLAHRDSGLLDQSNQSAIEAALKPFAEADDPSVIIGRSGHWAVGWIDEAIIKVYEADGSTVTPAFTALAGLLVSLDEYPILDEEDYSERELDATYENVKSACRSFLRDNPPEDWADRVCRWINDHFPNALENSDDQGGYPEAPIVKQALRALRLSEPRRLFKANILIRVRNRLGVDRAVFVNVYRPNPAYPF